MVLWRVIKFRKWFRPPFFIPWFLTWGKWKVSSEKSVFITFDDGPNKDTTPWLLNFCKENNVKVTFFWLGKNIDCLPEFVKLAKAAGHNVGSHGYDHINAFEEKKELVKMNIKKGLELVPDNIFRPPYGLLHFPLAKKLSKNTPIIMWSWLSYDWDKSIADKRIIASLEKNIKPGDILVFHENDNSEKRIKRIFPSIVKIIHEKGLQTALIK